MHPLIMELVHGDYWAILKNTPLAEIGRLGEMWFSIDSGCCRSPYEGTPSTQGEEACPGQHLGSRVPTSHRTAPASVNPNARSHKIFRQF